MEQFYAILWTAVGILITGLASWLSVVLTNFLNSKIKDKKIAKITTELTNIVFNSVTYVTQTYVDTLKKNGKFDANAHIEAFNTCKKLVMTQLSEEIKEYITNTYGDLEAYITSLIESQIYMLKK